MLFLKIFKWVWLTVTGIIFLVVVSIFAWKASQISPEKANQKCQDLYKQVENDLAKIQGVQLLNGNKTCTPSVDEAGMTDYYFYTYFRIYRNGNESVEGLKNNIKYIAEHFPKIDYTVYISNDTGINSRKDTICLEADRQIQEDGSVFNMTNSGVNTNYQAPSLSSNEKYNSSCEGK